jgi:hypothetical protein
LLHDDVVVVVPPLELPPPRRQNPVAEPVVLKVGSNAPISWRSAAETVTGHEPEHVAMGLSDVSTHEINVFDELTPMAK